MAADGRARSAERGRWTVPLAGPAPAASGRLAVALAVGLFGAALGAYLVGAGRSYGYDESLTVGMFVRVPSMLDPFRRQVVFNNHPLFSFLEHLVWSAGGGTEAWLRVLPAVFGAGTVAVSGWWLAWRWGAPAAIVGAAVLATNPAFAGASRTVRGYSLLAFLAVVSTLLMMRLVAGDERRWTGVAYVLVTAAGLAAHFYMGLVLVAHIAYVLSRGGAVAQWRARWYASSTLGALAYLGMADTMASAAKGRGRHFYASFPLDAVRTVLGKNPLAVVSLALLVAAVCRVVGMRRTVLLPAAVVTSLLVVLWLVVQPQDLYPRFLVWLVPGVAACVTMAVARWRLAAAAPALIAVIAMVVTEVPDWRADDMALPRAASIVDAARARGDTPCAVGGESLLAYTPIPPREVARGPVEDCDLIVRILGGDRLGDRAAGFRRVERIGEGGVVVLRR